MRPYCLVDQPAALVACVARIKIRNRLCISCWKPISRETLRTLLNNLYEFVEMVNLVALIYVMLLLFPYLCFHTNAMRFNMHPTVRVFPLPTTNNWGKSAFSRKRQKNPATSLIIFIFNKVPIWFSVFPHLLRCTEHSETKYNV